MRPARRAGNLATGRERYRVDPSGLVVVPRGGWREFLWSTGEL